MSRKRADRLCPETAQIFHKWLKGVARRWLQHGRSLTNGVLGPCLRTGRAPLPTRERDWLMRLRRDRRPPVKKAFELVRRFYRHGEDAPDYLVKALFAEYGVPDEPLFVVPKGTGGEIATRIATLLGEQGIHIGKPASQALEVYFAKFEIFDRQLEWISGPLYFLKSVHGRKGWARVLRAQFGEAAKCEECYVATRFHGERFCDRHNEANAGRTEVPKWTVMLEDLAATMKFDVRKADEK